MSRSVEIAILSVESGPLYIDIERFRSKKSFLDVGILARLTEAVDRGDAPAAIGLLRAAVPDYEPSTAVVADRETERPATSERLARTALAERV